MYIMHNFHIQYATAFTTFLIKQFKAKGRNLTMREGFLILSSEVLSKTYVFFRKTHSDVVVFRVHI